MPAAQLAVAPAPEPAALPALPRGAVSAALFVAVLLPAALLAALGLLLILLNYNILNWME